MIKPANIILTLVGGAVIGGTALDHHLHSRSRAEAQAEDDWGAAAQAQVVNGKTYANNYYVVGAGYYHAPCHAFFPLPFNSHDAAKGYYYCGQWWPTPSTSTITSSVPTQARVASARSNYIHYHAFHSGWHSSSSSFGGHSSSSSSSVSRGGFGSSAHGSSGGSHGSGS